MDWLWQNAAWIGLMCSGAICVWVSRKLKSYRETPPKRIPKNWFPDIKDVSND